MYCCISLLSITQGNQKLNFYTISGAFAVYQTRRTIRGGRVCTAPHHPSYPHPPLVQHVSELPNLPSLSSINPTALMPCPGPLSDQHVSRHTNKPLETAGAPGTNLRCFTYNNTTVATTTTTNERHDHHKDKCNNSCIFCGNFADWMRTRETQCR